MKLLYQKPKVVEGVRVKYVRPIVWIRTYDCTNWSKSPTAELPFLILKTQEIIWLCNRFSTCSTTEAETINL